MENLFYQPAIVTGIHYLDQEESKHCIRVLRKKQGENILITDGLGHLYKALITNPNPAKCEFTIQSVTEDPKRNYNIHLAISPTKNSDRIEWMVEKCVEIGIDEVTLLLCRNTEKKKFKTTRIEKLAISAMKQSHRGWLPKINPLTSFNDFIKSLPPNTTNYIAYVDQSNPNHLLHLAKPSEDYVVMVGPEGDFSPDEIDIATQQAFKKVSLGNYRLRTETAGLAVCQILNLINAE